MFDGVPVSFVTAKMAIQIGSSVKMFDSVPVSFVTAKMAIQIGHYSKFN